MGLVSLIGGALTAGARFLGIGATAVGGAATRGLLPTLGRAAISPFVTGAAGGALGALAFAGGDGAAGPAAGSQLASAQAAGAQITTLSGGRFMAVAANGDVQLFNRNGMAIRPQLIIPAGQRLPGGALVVSTRQNGALIGITKRRRRTAFRTEIRKVRSTIQGCRAVLAAAEKPRRRSSHA